MVHHADTHQTSAVSIQQRPINTRHTASRTYNGTHLKAPSCHRVWREPLLLLGYEEGGEDDNIEKLFEQDLSDVSSVSIESELGLDGSW